jgi:hypothetical protein
MINFTQNFWHDHGVFFLIFMMIFPRLTLLFATSVTFGVFAWIGWLIGPRVVAAYYASVFYWDSNPFLVAIAWVLSISTLLGWAGVINRKLGR